MRRPHRPVPTLASLLPLSLLLCFASPARAGEEARRDLAAIFPAAAARVSSPADSVDADVRHDETISNADAAAALEATGAIVRQASPFFLQVVVRTDSSHLAEIAAQPWVRRIWPVPAGEVELQLDGSRASIGVDLVTPPNPPNLTGSGVRAGMWDSPTPQHADFGSRLTVVNTSQITPTLHATHVGTIIAGDGSQSAANGGTPNQWRGMATAASLYAWDIYLSWPSYANQMLAGVTNQSITLANNSWCYIASSVPCGSQCQIFGAYDIFCPDFDRLVRLQDLNLFFSAGNYRNNFCGLNYGSVNPPSTAKNVVCVGAIDKFDNPAAFSGWGPTDDGRLKPDCVAVGFVVKAGDEAPPNTYTSLSGTSMSSPAAAGAATLLTERFQQVNSGTLPKPALLKNIMLNTATDLGTAGPDFSFGYGKINAARAVRLINQARWLQDSVAHGGIRTFTFSVAAPCSLKVMLTWSDVENWNAPCNTPSLINDLDLELQPPSGPNVLPLTLNPTLPANPAVPLANHRDNVEQCVVASAQPGVWTIVVKGFNVPQGPMQPFAVTWESGTVNCFQAPGSNSRCVKPPVGLVAWWPLGDPVSQPIVDIAGPNTGAPVGGPFPIPGKVGGATHFGGANYGVVPPNPSLDIGTGSISIDAWVYDFVTGGPRFIVDKVDINNVGYRFGINASGLLTFGLKDVSSNTGVWTSTTAVPSSQWAHVAASVDRTASLGTFYVNGAPAGTFNPGTVPGNTNAGQDLWIGKAHNGSGIEVRLDEIQIFKRALTANEVKTIFAADSAGKCREFCRMKQYWPICVNGTSIIIYPQICNYTGATQTYSYSVTGLPTGPGCTVAGPLPSDITYLSANPVTVPPGGCVTVAIKINKPVGLTGIGQTSCFNFCVQNIATLNTFCCKGALVGTMPWWCIHHLLPPIPGQLASPYPDVAEVLNGQSRAVTFRVANTGAPTGAMHYRIYAAPEETDPVSVVSLNGLPPGEPWEGDLVVAPGDSADVTVDVAFEVPDPLGTHQLVFAFDMDGDGVPDPAASLALRSVDAYSSTVDVSSPPAVAGIGLTARPNPFRGTAEIAFRLARGGKVAVDVYDISGRRVRRLVDEVLAPGPQRISWDGRDDAGQLVRGGVFFVRVRAADEHGSRVLLRLP